jgi:putative CRISPR-associated protein (TIGR02619 family)
VNRERPTVLVSPCGTSVLTNGLDDEQRKPINKLANCREEDLPEKDRQALDEHIQNRHRTLIEGTPGREQVKKLSAELNGILTYYEGIPKHTGGAPDQHILIVSDTYLGNRVGEIIESWLHSNRYAVQVWSPPGLVTNDRESFRDAMQELIRQCEDEIKGYSDSGYHIAFNLTGGFKSVQGFLQTLGMFYAEETFYIFETGSLLTIPRLPITINVSKPVGEHLGVFRKFELAQEIPLQDCAGIPDTLLLEHDGKAVLSEWGELVWQRSKNQFYGEKLLDPLPGIEHGPQFPKQVQKQGLTPGYLSTLNKRLDQLSLVAHDNGANLKGLDFKPLKGNPKSPSTHECDIWAGDEHRMFGHYSDGNFIVDAIDRGLH